MWISLKTLHFTSKLFKINTNIWSILFDDCAWNLHNSAWDYDTVTWIRNRLVFENTMHLRINVNTVLGVLSVKGDFLKNLRVIHPSIVWEIHVCNFCSSLYLVCPDSWRTPPIIIIGEIFSGASQVITSCSTPTRREWSTTSSHEPGKNIHPINLRTSEEHKLIDRLHIFQGGPS